MATAIEPCPFCRSQHLHLTHSGLTYCVVCERCKSKGPHWDNLEDAINRWNQTSLRATRTRPEYTEEAEATTGLARPIHYSAG